MTETTFKFADLSKEAKERAREEYRESNSFDEYHYDCIFEDAVAIAALLGITIDKRGYSDDPGAWAKKPDISFSGFCSQGDGASFQGSYTYVPDAITSVTAYCFKDETILRIATKLSVLQATRVLLSLEPLTGEILTYGSYCHSGTMRFDSRHPDDSESHELDDQHEEQIIQLMRDFADWIYERLEAEYDYIDSDEYIDEQLQDDEFDEDGNLV